MSRNNKGRCSICLWKRQVSVSGEGCSPVQRSINASRREQYASRPGSVLAIRRSYTSCKLSVLNWRPLGSNS
eukprot:1281271-Heterocapsa_arctica.AAC.1